MASSPLSIFRKYQYILLVFFGVLLMFAFVVAPPLDEYLRSRGGAGRDATVVTWKHGAMSYQDLGQANALHQRTMTFLQEVEQLTQQREGAPKTPYRLTSFRAQTERDLVQTLVLAKKAEEMGIVITDQAINDYLDQLSDETLQVDDLRDILRQPNVNLSEMQLFKQLRTELAATQMRMLAMSGVQAISPSMLWEYHNRLFQRMQTEMLPVRVAEFTDKVPDPSEREIVELYAQYKEQYPHPESPEPGFRVRKKIAFDYLEGRLEKFQEAEAAQISDEEILKEYEEGKARGEFRVDDSSGQSPRGGATPATPPAGVEPAEDTPAEDTPAEDTPAEDTPAEDTPAENKPAEDKPAEDKPAEDKPAEDKPAEDKPAEDKPAEDTPAEDTPAEDKPAEENNPQSSDRNRESADRLFVALQDDDTPPEEATPVEEATPAAEDSPPVPDLPAATAPANEEGGSPAGEGLGNEEFRSLEEVRDSIVRRLARSRAQEKVDDAMEKARREVNDYFRLLNNWEAVGKQEGEQKPAPPDVKTLAKKYGLIADRTKLLDQIEIGDTKLGKAYRFTFRGNRPGRMSFAEIAYAQGFPLYKPESISGAEQGVEYLYWKVDEKDAYTPSLDQARDRVVEAYKRMKALPLAKERAQELAEQAEAKSEQGFSETLEEMPEDPFTTEEFTWMTQGNTAFGMPGQLMLSNIEKVEGISDDFMKEIFALEEGKVGVVVNEPQSVVYVVRVVAKSPSEQERREQFLASGFGRTQMQLAQFDQSRYFSQWYQELEQEMKVDWRRPVE